jgi:hypothetical protein
MKAGLCVRLLSMVVACALTHCATGDSVDADGGFEGDAPGGTVQESGGSSGGIDATSAGDATMAGDAMDATNDHRDAATGDAGIDATVSAEDASSDVTVLSDATIAADSSSDAPPATDAPSGDAGAVDANAADVVAEAVADAPADAAADDAGSNGNDAGGSPPEAGADGASCPADTQFPQTTFVNLAVTPGVALDPGENDAIPGDAGASAPAGWNFYLISGALCRDGSPTGIYVHHGSANKLFIYLEGGGACSSATFCSHNPANISSSFPGGAQSQGQTIVGSIEAFSSTPQEPYVPTAASGATPAYSPGIFDFTNTANPFQDWSAVYVPYCTGDVHFGTADNVTIPTDGVLPALTNQHFVGYLNMQKFVARIVPTFSDVSQVLLTGASAGGFGAGLNYGLVQDSFGSVPVVVLDDSGPPLGVQYLPPCLQQQWRALWGFDAALPSDCAECFNSDGSGLTNIVLYWRNKYKNARVGIVSTMQDEVMRLFFASGDNTCASNNATLLDGEQLLGGYTGAEYTQGLDDLVSTYQCTGALAAYLIGGQNSAFPNPTYHQHIFRSEFYQAITNDGGITMSQWASDLVNGNLEIVGP